MPERDLIFVTKATGFLKRDVVPYLLQKGYHLRVLVDPSENPSNLPALEDEQLVEFLTGDITDPQLVRRAMDGCRFVVHAAGHFHLWGHPEPLNRSNVLGTETIAEAALHACIERLVYVSTLAVVGQPRPGEVIDEDSPCHPIDPYQVSRYRAEQQISGLIQAGGLPAIILRPGALYGPGAHYGFNHLFIEDPLRGVRLQVDGGRHLIFPAYAPDVARAIFLAFTAPHTSNGPVGQIYNICNRPVSHHQINRIVSHLLGISTVRYNIPKWALVSLARLMERWAVRTGSESPYPLNLRYYMFTDWVVSNEKARVELAFIPTPLEAGLRATVEWYKKNHQKRGRK